jgi:hypothetical protein
MPDVPEVATPPARRTSPALVVSGVLMIIAGLLLANPYRGATDTRWPWEILFSSEAPARARANWSIWFLFALGAIVMGAMPVRRLRAPVLLTGALILAVTCCARDAGLAITQVTLGWFAGVSLLMAGFLLQAQGYLPSAARSLASLGAVFVLWTLASSFGSGEAGVPEAHLKVIVRDSLTRVAHGTVPDARPNYDIDLWSYSAVIVASVIALAGWVGARGTLVGISGFLLVLVYFLVPTFDKLGVLFAASSGAEALSLTLSDALIHTGLALGLFSALAVADLARLEADRP